MFQIRFLVARRAIRRWPAAAFRRWPDRALATGRIYSLIVRPSYEGRTLLVRRLDRVRIGDLARTGEECGLLGLSGRGALRPAVRDVRPVQVRVVDASTVQELADRPELEAVASLPRRDVSGHD